jgi:hypothetical protein
VPPPTRPLAPPDLPLSFREEIVPHVFASVQGSASVALVALPGVGLSNTLRFLAEPRLAAYYLGAAAETWLPVFIEADRWLSPPAVFIETARAVVAAAQARGWPRAEQAALRHRFEAAAAAPLPQPATPLAEVLAHVCDTLGRRVLLLCDEFDPALVQLPAAALRELRALRDNHKFHLNYVVGLRHDPSAILARRSSAEAGHAGVAKLVELFDTHTFPLRPYSPADAQVAATRKTVGWNPPLDPAETESLYRATGGHAKLLIAALAVLENRRGLAWANVERALLADPTLIDTCRALWQDLTPDEQLALWRLAREHTDALSEAGLAHLRLRGLAVGGPPFVFASLFEAFVIGQPEPEPLPVASLPSRLRDPGAAPRW